MSGAKPVIDERVQREYAAGANDYDRRWAKYNRRSIALLRPYLVEETGALLDVGCGTGNLLSALQAWGAPVAHYAGLDPSAEMLRTATAKAAATAPPFPLEWVRAGASALPFGAGEWDTVVSASALHYWPDAALCCREMRRVLRPGGRLVLLDWCADYLSIRLIGRFLRLTRKPFAHIYRSAALRDLLSAVGFGEVRIERARITPLWGLMVAVVRAE